MPMDVVVAGAGIAGLTLALTCEQVGVPVRVYEAGRELLPFGLGIGLQPNAVRELCDLGLEEELAAIGYPTRAWTLIGRNGREIWKSKNGPSSVVPTPKDRRCRPSPNCGSVARVAIVRP